MFQLEETPKTALDILEFKKIITPYRFYYEIPHDIELQKYSGMKFLSTPFEKFIFEKRIQNVLIGYVSPNIHLGKLEQDFRGKRIIKITDVYLPRFEEESWRKTNGYIKLD